MKAVINVKMDNAAFQDLPMSELARILNTLAYRIEEYSEADCNIYDINGIKVGTFKIIGRSHELVL